MSATGLHIKGLSAGYRRKPEVLKELSLGPLLPGRVTALVGPNAAGKSTLLRSLAGLLGARGHVVWNGEDLLSASLRRKASVISYMPQNLPHDVELTVIESLVSALKASPLDNLSIRLPEARDRAFEVLTQMEIVELALEPLNQLSGGQRQLVSLAQAIIRSPAILLLDEPTSALDLQHQVTVMDLVRAYAAKGNTVVMVMHDINLATRWADDIIVMNQGKIIASGKPADILTKELLASVYRVNAAVETLGSGFIQISVESITR